MKQSILLVLVAHLFAIHCVLVKDLAGRDKQNGKDLCESYDSGQKCQRCIEGYDLIQEECVQNDNVDQGEELDDQEEQADEEQEQSLCQQQMGCGDPFNFKNKQQFDKMMGVMKSNGFRSPMLGFTLNEQETEKHPPKPPQYSQTNNQAQGVDQAYQTKTDGEFIYTISDNIFSIVQVTPPEQAKLVYKQDLKYGAMTSLLIAENHVAIFGVGKDQQKYSTVVIIYDVTNRYKPNRLKNFEISGYFDTARKLNGGVVYFISFYQYNIRKIEQPYYNMGQGKQQIPYKNIFYYGSPINMPSLSIIVTFNLQSPTDNKEYNIISILSTSYPFYYFSPYNLYLLQNNKDRSISYIRKIYLNGSEISPGFSQAVLGKIGNSFFMDYHEGFLRIATTYLYGKGAIQTYNNLYVLDGKMNFVGKLEEIVANQKIYSVRFSQSKAFIVTFQKIDPFFVIDLSNQAQPKIIGQLKIPGFSNYLQLYNQDTMIGIGKQQDQGSNQFTIKISVFDISDLNNPVQSSKYSFDQQISKTLSITQPKSLLLAPNKNILVVPIMSTDFTGVYMFSLSTDSPISLLQIITHTKYPQNMHQVTSSLYIGDNLYTKSLCLLKIHSLSSPYKQLNSLSLPCGFGQDEINDEGQVLYAQYIMYASKQQKIQAKDLYPFQTDPALWKQAERKFHLTKSEAQKDFF